jgi:hypothetical protein
MARRNLTTRVNRPEKSLEIKDFQAPKGGSGAGTRTPDTRIMIPLL